MMIARGIREKVISTVNCSVLYCVRQLCTEKHTRMSGSYSCLLVYVKVFFLSPVYTIQPVVKPVVKIVCTNIQPVGKPV